MVDLGGGTRERFQDFDTADPEDVLPPVSTVSYYHPHHASRTSSWRHSLQEQDVGNRSNFLESMHHDLVQIKNDPENLSRICNSTSSMPFVEGSADSFLEAAEDVKAKGQLFQEITQAAETFEPYSSSPSSGCYRNYVLPPEPSCHAEYIFSDTSQWSWNRSPADDRGLAVSSGGNLLVESGQSNETVIASLQYTVPSHLIPDTFSSCLPSLSLTQPPTSVPSCSSMQQTSPSTLTSSVLDLSPGPPPTAHQLPPLQSSIVTQASTHVVAVSSPPSAHQLPPLQPSFISLDMAPQALSTHHALDDALDLVAVENHEKAPEYEPRHECRHCGALFSRLPYLKYHIKAHLDEMAGSCAKQEDETQALELHDPKPTHVLQTAEKPKQEDKALPLELNELKPKRVLQTTEKHFTCKHCNETFSQAEKLKVHELNHSGERPFKCSECSTAFSAKAMLIRHMKVHTGEKPYSCDECKTCFTEAGSLKVHKRLHSGEKPFKCDQCDIAFNGAGMLATHKRKHTGEKPYRCNECGETFRLLSTLKSHRRRHTGEKPFVCEVCGASFTQRAAMQRHKRIHSNQKPWKCEQCGYKFREKENLRKHIALHQIKLQHTCNICGSGFNQAKKLEIHKMLHNGGDRPYQCNKCPSTFTNPKYLAQHKKRVHDKKGSIRCEECHKTFKRKEILRSHLRIHKGERPYVCEECGAAFNQRGTLTKHIRNHTERPYACEECGAVFTQRGTLTKHIRNHTNSVSICEKKSDENYVEISAVDHKLDDIKTGDVSLRCPTCNVSVSTQEELVRHKRTSHPSLRTAQNNSGSEQEVDDSSEHIRDKYVCEECDQIFFRRRQLKAHKKYCPCICSTRQSGPSKHTNINTAFQSDTTKEVDAMKLLTAALAVTDSEVSDSLGYQNSVGRGQLSSASSVEHSLERYPSPPSVPSAVEQPHRYSSPHLPTGDSLFPHHVNIHQPQNRIHQPSQQEVHLSQPLQQNQLQQPLQDHLQQLPHQMTLQHLSQSNLSHLSDQSDQLQHSPQSNMSQSPHQHDHMQHSDHLQPLTQEHNSLHQSSQQHNHPQQSSQDPVHQLPLQHEHLLLSSREQSHLQLPSRPQSHLQQSSREQSHLQLPSRVLSHLQLSSRELSNLQLPSGEQNHLQMPSRKQGHLQLPSSEQSCLQLSSRDQSHLQQIPSQVPNPVHLQQPPKQHSSNLQRSLKENSRVHQTGKSNLQQSSGQQNHLQHHPQQQEQTQQSSHGSDQFHQSLRQDHLQNHLHFYEIVQQEFYKESSSSLSSQQIHHHTRQLQLLDQPDQNVTSEEDCLHQEFQQDLQENLEDCDDFVPNMHHQEQQEPDYCDQHLHHLHEPKHEELSETEHDGRYHRSPHCHHPSSPLENTNSVKFLDILS